MHVSRDQGLLSRSGYCVWMLILSRLWLLHLPSSALPRPLQGRTSLPSACGEVLSARSCRTFLSYVRPWWSLASPT